jgi:diguanylate cyclase (GGDEF)-like protein
MGSFAGAAEDLLERRRPDETRRLARRELTIELLAAGLFALTAIALVLSLPTPGGLDTMPAALLVSAYALVSRVKFQLGPGFLRPTQLVFIPMVFLLWAPAVPLLVAAGALLGQLPDVVRRGARPERLLVAVADSWYAIGPAVLVGLVAPVELTWAGWPVYALALLAQFAGDLVVSTLREWLGSAMPPVAQAKVIGLVYLADTLLAPIGLLAVFAATAQPYAYLLAVPSGALLALVARERSARIERALALGRAYRASALLLESQAEDLRRQTARLERSHRRVGDAVASILDRAAVERILLTTVLDALEAGVARVDARASSGRLAERARAGDDRWCPSALSAAQDAVGPDGRPVQVTHGDVSALAVRLGGGPEVLAVARAGERFSGAERDLLADLAAQAVVSFEKVVAHETVSRQANVDELTGLLNRRRLDEVLTQELEVADRTERPVALVMIDVDNFKRVNDGHGHQVGDRVLAEIGQVARSVAREQDHAGRYGGEELAVVLPGAGLAEAALVADRLRRAVGEHAIPLAGGQTLGVTVSVGVASVPVAAADRESLVAAADAALYVAKRTGKNRVVCAPRLAHLELQDERPAAGRFRAATRR